MIPKRKFNIGKNAELKTEKNISCWVVYHQSREFIETDDFRDYSHKIGYGESEGQKIDLQNYEQVAIAVIGKNNKYGMDEHSLWRLTNNVMESWSKDFPKEYGNFIKTGFSFRSLNMCPSGMGTRSSMVGDMFWNVSEDKWYMIMGLGFKEVIPCNKLKENEINGLLYTYMGYISEEIENEFDMSLGGYLGQ